MWYAVHCSPRIDNKGERLPCLNRRTPSPRSTRSATRWATRRIGQTIGNSAGVLLLGWIGYDTALADAGLAQSAGTIVGIKVLCVLLPAIFIVGSWAAFKYVWNITPEIRAEIAAKKSALSGK